MLCDGRQDQSGWMCGENHEEDFSHPVYPVRSFHFILGQRISGLPGVMAKSFLKIVLAFRFGICDLSDNFDDERLSERDLCLF